MYDDPFRWEDPHGCDNVVTVAMGEQKLHISVSQEQAVDSYNDTFECEVAIPISEIYKLRNYINSVLSEVERRS